jgi:hypothetical protein
MIEAPTQLAGLLLPLLPMKNFLLILVLLLAFDSHAQVLDKVKAEQAKEAVRADIERRVSARKVSYQPGKFQTAPYANTEQNPAFVGGIVVVHTFHTKDSTEFVKPYRVSYLITTAGKVYVQEVFNPR